MSLYLLDWFKFPTFGEVNFFKCSKDEYLWQVPIGVTSISAVLIGAGGAGAAGGNQTQSSGGGGGGLRWINGMPVVPGEILRIKVGCGGTGQFPGIFDATGQLDAFSQGNGFAGDDGVDCYIASDNNATTPGRTGIGDTIIVVAGGGRGGRIRVANNTPQPGGIGGTGSLLGSYSWGTVGGSNGGIGGTAYNTGGAADGGGGGAAGWLSNPAAPEYDLDYTGQGEPTGGYGGGNDGSGAGRHWPSNGRQGGGGGGVFTGGGNSNCGGGGGGVGIVWGAGPNGLGGGQRRVDNEDYNAPGQGGSWGADGKASGNVDDQFFYNAANTNNRVVSYDEDGTTTNTTPGFVDLFNHSLGNGIRGFNDSLADNVLDDFQGKVRLGGGGQFGGGGGGTDASGSEVSKSGPGGDGAVRIIFAARTKLTRNYPVGIITDNANLLTDYGYYDDAAGPPARAGIGTGTVVDPVGFTT